MLSRSIINFAVFWAFLAAPSLCTSGLLAHACPSHACDACRHEDGCGDDPCVKCSPNSIDSVTAAKWLECSNQLYAIVAIDAFIVRDLPTAHLGWYIPPPRTNAPAPGECLPLLI